MQHLPASRWWYFPEKIARKCQKRGLIWKRRRTIKSKDDIFHPKKGDNENQLKQQKQQESQEAIPMKIRTLKLRWKINNSVVQTQLLSF
jgi:hypothetical protein